MDDAAAEQVRRMRECVDATLRSVQEMVDLARDKYGQSADEAMLGIRGAFEARARRVVSAADDVGARADYANYCAVLVLLLEERARCAALQEAVEFRDSVINILGEIDSL